MAALGESSSSPATVKTKPFIVRVKPKVSQEPFDALWLEINEHTSRALTFEDLLERSLSPYFDLSSSASFEESRTKRVLVQHVETISGSECTKDALLTFLDLVVNVSLSFLWSIHMFVYLAIV
ncbi:hypothetical protein IHE45_07G104100 [Dioscorea alata]|uniref:Uncharacterized protein n=1 Tax=Dioscorea alata TaxID=55571 RepID=A0ACB7VTG3_DIOAL|nr:hypothetical protein IHE45_07G104100 [Dioscorea alata]